MSHLFYHTEGIILRTIPFRDHDAILTLFTPDRGIIKILVRGKAKQRAAAGISVPLTQVELIYRERRGEIFSCHDITLVNSFSFLRKDLVFLEVGCDLLQVILSSQFMGKEAPRLYTLLCLYLSKILQTLHPWTLAMSFRLKLLKHDGLVSFPFVCSDCQCYLDQAAYTQGPESWCEQHQPIGSQHWTQQELETVYQLSLCQHYQDLQQLEVTTELQNKIRQFFDVSVKGHFI